LKVTLLSSGVASSSFEQELKNKNAETAASARILVFIFVNFKVI